MDIASVLKKAVDKRSTLFEDSSTNCFRLFNAQGDGIDGLTIDLYGEYLLLQYFSDAVMEKEKQIIKALDETLECIPVSLKGVLAKNRIKIDGNQDYASIRRSSVIIGDKPPEKYTVIQNDVKAYVDLIEGQSTGIFLDMRQMREAMVPFYKHGGSILNLFSYTALFSIHALKNGIKHSLNIDLSRAVLKKAEENYALNGLVIDSRDFIYGDTLQWMKKIDKKKQFFSLIVFDPPTFSRNRKKTFSVKKNYIQSMEIAQKICPGGILMSAINSYSVSQKEYISYHPDKWELLLFKNESSDFVHQGNPYLKAGLWKIPEIIR